VIVQCGQCGSDVKKAPYMVRRAEESGAGLYCNSACAGLARLSAPRRRATITCPHCGETAQKKWSRVNAAKKAGLPIYCSRGCYVLANKLTPTERKRRRRAWDVAWKARNSAYVKARAAERHRARRDAGWRPPSRAKPKRAAVCGHCGEETPRTEGRIERAEALGYSFYCGEECRQDATAARLSKLYAETGRRAYAVDTYGEDFAGAWLAMMGLKEEIRNNKRGEDNG
tara:strand:+ start:487 stop:1170 length:684 start_codon:yes stop_codon:yes gene_type:complete